MRALPAAQGQLTIVVDEFPALAHRPDVLDAVRELGLLGRKPGLALNDRAPNGLPRFWQYPTVEEYTAAWTTTAPTRPAPREHGRQGAVAHGH